MRRFGLIGNPLIHSFSPSYFEEKFKHEGILDARYDAFPLASIEDFHILVAQNDDLCGLNVTIPYKKTIIPYLDYIDSDANCIGAVNCIKIIHAYELSDNQIAKFFAGKAPKFGNKYLLGFNTDAPAFAEALTEGWNLPSTALVFGTGGAAQAVIHALTILGIDYTLVSRNPSTKYILRYSEIPDDIWRNNKLWINTTPVGMWPEAEKVLPLPFQHINSDFYLFDLIYNPLETSFIESGKKFGAHTKNGLAMLHLQANRSWDIFTASPEFAHASVLKEREQPFC